MIRTYTNLIDIPTLEGRFEYCKLQGAVADPTFGSFRQVNQRFYSSPEWKSFRESILRRDNFCELGHPDWPIPGALYVHHLNPLEPEDIILVKPCCFDPDNAITVSFQMHQAITYGLPFPLRYEPLVERRPNDTCPWIKG